MFFFLLYSSQTMLWMETHGVVGTDNVIFPLKFDLLNCFVCGFQGALFLQKNNTYREKLAADGIRPPTEK